ncbi:DUF2264 domain-containing protein [Saccharopolyspora griseoalba]|uniref:DUF2264 domain-containing protein n=1 Tax=Saccharopolyspora griseoalba TaxID=1431848 RepID=A0ABW2LLX6_9PSEU
MLPEEDRELSPHTGFTRLHWEAAADGLLAAAWRWASPSGGRLDLPGRPSRSGARSDGLEGFARTMLAAAFRTAGGADPRGWLERYADGLDAGTRTPGTDDAESWPVIRDHHAFGQPMVESASVALGLRLTRPLLWDRLDGSVQDRVEAWLRGALRSLPAPNNWYLFPFSVAGFLESVGRGDADTARVRQRALELLETWYRGQGWYTDGDGQAFDHYNGWALHLYPVLDAHLDGRSTEHAARLREFLSGFGLMFGADGAPVYFGRSMTYRFAAASAVGLGAVTGSTPLSPGVSRRLISGNLRYFLDRGCLDEDGLLSLGWHGPHEATLQPYSGPASPYWASKAFTCLLAGPDHPLWTEQEEPAPGEQEWAVALPGPGLLLQTSGGIARLHNHGSGHLRPHQAAIAAEADPLYDRQAYSSSTGPTARDNVADNHFAVVFRGSRSARRRVEPLGAGGAGELGWAASRHVPVFDGPVAALPGLRVDSVVVVRGWLELRVHRVTGAPPEAGAELTGWAAGDELVSALHPLHGWESADEVLAPAGTAFARSVRVPRLSGSGNGVFAALAGLTAEPVELRGAVAGVRAQHDRLEVRWSDGTTTLVSFEPVEVR